MRTLLSIFLFLILSSKSYSLELSVEGLTDALGDVTKELEKVVQDNSKSEETETELETSTNDNNFNNYPVEINLKSKDYFNGCGHASAQYKFYEGNEFQLIYFCSEDSNETKYIGNFKNISDDLSEFSKVSTIMDLEGTQYKDIISLNKDNAKISWNGGDPIVYEYFSNEANVVVQKNNETTNNDTSSTKPEKQETEKTVDESKGGYKDFYFDMNISQIKNVVNQVCPQAEFSDKTSWGESLGYWDAPSCIDFRGKKTSLNFYTSEEDTIDKIILKNVDLSLDSMDFATYYSEDESGFVIYDEIVGKFLNSAKYELVRFPTKEEIDLFNSFDDLKILTGDASVNTVFKNLKTGNLVYHTMKRNKYNNYGYEYDLIYLSPNASKSILKEEDSKTVSDDDI